MSNTDKKVLELKSLVEGAELSLQQARKILETLTGDEGAMLSEQAKHVGSMTTSQDGQVIEGLFDGQNMLGPDGKRYSVPANYASKSKLVEGDGLKLTIMPDGSFVYKQINLLERDRLVGILAIDEKTDEYRVVANGKSYKVLTASITYYKGESGNSVTILVPKGKETSWAAVENVFKAGEEIPGLTPVMEKQEEKPAEAKKVVFDELPELEAAAAEVEPSEFLVPEEKSMPAPTADTSDSFLAGEGKDFYGPTAPTSPTASQPNSFLNDESGQTDSLQEKDSQGLEDI